MDHKYLSTSCFHGQHEYCKAKHGLAGPKKPAECKFCGSRCICLCHGENEKTPPDQNA